MDGGLASTVTSGYRAVIWNIRVRVGHNYRTAGKPGTNESQRNWTEGLRQSSYGKPCLPRLIGFEAHWQRSLWLQDLNLPISLKPHMSDFEVTFRRTIGQVDEEALFTSSEKSAMNADSKPPPIEKGGQNSIYNLENNFDHLLSAVVKGNHRPAN